MGGSASGALNASGFKQSIKQNRLPGYEHITHNGIFNENFFDVGDRAKNLLQIHHGLGISNCDLYDLPKRNYFLSLFLKSNTDGQKRTRPLNVVVCLDISGSMNTQLNHSQEGHGAKSRLDLSREAIFMLYQKLQDNDAFSLVVFHTQARTILKSTFKKFLDDDQVRKIINEKFQSGGTTIKEGFNESVKNIKQFRQANTLTSDYEHRIVMLTDVNDNSVQNQKILIDQISSQDNINTTIIGVSSDFQSKTCEQLIEVKGFNYFCAVENADLQTYLADRFDYNFFPCVKKVNITIDSDMIDSIQTFGTVDSHKKYEKIGNRLTVTKMQTGFPSDLQTNKQGKIQTQGGLILVKLKLKDEKQLPRINLKINLEYRDLSQKIFVEEYSVDKKLQVQQYYSDSAIEKGVHLFYYTQTMRNLLKDMRSEDKNKVLNDETKFLYKEKLEKLKEFCPKEKLEELTKVITIVEQHKAGPN